MIDNYKNIEFQLYGYLIQLRELFKTNRIGEYEIKKINELIELIESRRFNVAVMGEFKRGKSSLINAILGVKILPADVTPTTATINRITYGNEPSMKILYNDDTTEVVNVNNLSDYVTMLTEEGLKRALKVREAIIHYPTVICQNHVDIIDTPGLNDNKDMTKITISMLSNIDAVIMAISALAPFSQKETNFVCQLIKSDNIENIIFVVTYIDQIDEDEQEKFIEYIHNRICKSVYEHIKEENNSEEILIKTKRILNNSLIFGVSSLLALKSFITGDRELLKKSRFEEFKTELYEFLTAEQSVNMIVKVIKGIQSASNEFNELYRNEILKKEQALDCIEEKNSMIYQYCCDYRKIYDLEFNKNEKQLNECLNSIIGLKNIFINKFMNCLLQNQNKAQKELINDILTQGVQCWDIANKEYADKIKDQILNHKAMIIANCYNVRNVKLIEPIEALKDMFNFEFPYPEIFNTELQGDALKNLMASFGFPMFNWQVPLIPNNRYFNNNNLKDNLKYAVDISVQKLFEHWLIYTNAINKWFIQQADKEALIITKRLSNTVKNSSEQMKNELFLLKSAYNQQKITLQNIRMKTDVILNEIFKNEGGN